MRCELSILQLEKAYGRRLTKEEKERIKRIMHHDENSEHPKEEEAITC